MLLFLITRTFHLRGTHHIAADCALFAGQLLALVMSSELHHCHRED